MTLIEGIVTGLVVGAVATLTVVAILFYRAFRGFMQ